MEIETPKAKPGPKAKPKVDVEALERRIHNLEAAYYPHGSPIRNLSHSILLKAGLEPYTPTKGDMSKFKKVG